MDLDFVFETINPDETKDGISHQIQHHLMQPAPQQPNFAVAAEQQYRAGAQSLVDRGLVARPAAAAAIATTMRRHHYNNNGTGFEPYPQQLAIRPQPPTSSSDSSNNPFGAKSTTSFKRPTALHWSSNATKLCSWLSNTSRMPCINNIKIIEMFWVFLVFGFMYYHDEANKRPIEMPHPESHPLHLYSYLSFCFLFF